MSTRRSIALLCRMAYRKRPQRSTRGCRKRSCAPQKPRRAYIHVMSVLCTILTALHATQTHTTIWYIVYMCWSSSRPLEINDEKNKKKKLRVTAVVATVTPIVRRRRRPRPSHQPIYMSPYWRVYVYSRSVDHNTTATTGALNLCIPRGGRPGWAGPPRYGARNYLRGVRHIDEVLNKQTHHRWSRHHNQSRCITYNTQPNSSSSPQHRAQTNGNNKNDCGTHQYLAMHIFTALARLVSARETQ